MASEGKQYGLIMPKKANQGLIRPRPSVFEDNSDSEEEQQATDWVRKALKREAEKSVQKKQNRLDIQKALEEDPTVYQYDEVYDKIEEKKAEILSVKKQDKKPRYIQALLQQAEKRKREQERRNERIIQKEREAEGDEFKDKESFVTSAYRQKLEEFKKLEEEERRQDALEALTDVSKQKDLSGFYRHLYRVTVSGECSSTAVKQEKDEEKEVKEKEVKEKEVVEKEVVEKEVDEKEVDKKEVNEKEVNEKAVNVKEVNEKEVNEKEVNEKEVNEKELKEKEVKDKEVKEKESKEGEGKEKNCKEEGREKEDKRNNRIGRNEKTQNGEEEEEARSFAEENEQAENDDGCDSKTDDQISLQTTSSLNEKKHLSRHYRKRRDSASSHSDYEKSKGIKDKKDGNLDADSDFSVDSDSSAVSSCSSSSKSESGSSKKSNKSASGQKRKREMKDKHGKRKEKTDDKDDHKAPKRKHDENENDKNSSKKEKLEGSSNVDTNCHGTENGSKDKEAAVVEKKEKPPKQNIWLKRTVGEVFENALQRYYQRKAAKQANKG